MATQLVGGPLTKTMEREESTHRIYRLTYRVESDDLAMDTADGPQVVSETPGLPQPGDLYLIDGDTDQWAYCLPTMSVKPEIVNEPSKFWLVDLIFTTKLVERRIDNGLAAADPMLEPQKISGGFTKFTEEGLYDRFGRKICNSAHELIRGPQNEWDMSRQTVRIEQIVPQLQLDLFVPMLDTVNDRPLWNFPARYIKLMNATWQELFHRFTSYYKRVFDFEIWARKEDPGLRGPVATSSGWDRVLLDEGTKALRGEWVPSGTPTARIWTWTLLGNPRANNPADFIRFQDVNGNLSRVILDGAGRPYNPAGGQSVTTCSACPSGAPLSWFIAGFTGSLTTDDSDVLLNDSELAYTGGCTWTVTVAGVTMTLTYTGSVWQLTISGLTAANLVYTQGTWGCTSGNSLSGAVANNADAPASMYLSPGIFGSDQPGKISVQKYNESDFLLLGIPATLGP